jgi:hypothetical protein
MARQYSPRRFFRQAPNTLLKRYFIEHETLTEVDFEALTETHIEPLFAAWQGLLYEQREAMEADFRDIDTLACEGGIKAILDEARWHSRPEDSDLAERLSRMKSHHERAFWILLERPEYRKGALLFFHADTLPGSYWRKCKNLSRVKAHTDELSLNRLAQAIRDYFHSQEGRGRNCVVEAYRRNELDYFFAYPEDYAQSSVEWVRDTFEHRTHNPAFEIIFVYSQTEGTLDTYLRGGREPVSALQEMFAKIILEVFPKPDLEDDQVYDLNPLRDPHFPFRYQPDSGIKAVRPRSLRFSSTVNKGSRLILEGDCNCDPPGVYGLIEALAGALPLALYHVTRVELVVSFAPTPTTPARTRRFAITYPNSCALKYEGDDLLIRKMLEDSGIEPHSPAVEQASEPEPEALAEP